MKNTDKSLRNAVIYQIFTRNYKDGTFRAVEADLPRIRDLGADIIYLMPVQPSGEVHRKGSMGSPYAIKDYRVTDPVQGTMEDFISLTESAHSLGLKVMIDVVYNHTSPDSVLSKEHPEWFYHKPDGSFGNRIGDWWDVIDLDYSSAELWDYQIDTLKMWAEYVDGFRCDVAPMIPLDFWIKARAEVEEVRPGCIWLAESVEPMFIKMNRKAGVPTLSDSELYQAFDIDYDYDIYHLEADAMTGTGSLKDYLYELNRQEGVYPDNYIKLRCLENHDRPRAAALVPDEKVLRSWTAFNYFCKGTVMLYAGEENCTAHHPTLFDRDTVDFNTGRDISGLLAALSSIKKAPVFSDSAFEAHTCGIHDEVIEAVHEMNVCSKAKAAAGDAVKAVGFFSTTGRCQGLKADLPDGTYINAVNGRTIDVYEGTFPYDGEPVIILLEK